MIGEFDIAQGVREQAAGVQEAGGAAPAVCRVSRDIYRALVEMKAAEGAIGNLVIGTWMLDRIAVDRIRLRMVIDESLTGTELVVE